MCVQNLRRQPPIEGVSSVAERIVQPVVDVDEVEIVARLENPPEPRLPADDGALRVVLHVVDECDPRVELCLGDHSVQPGVELPFSQRHAVPLVGEGKHLARRGTQVGRQTEPQEIAGIEAAPFHLRREQRADDDWSCFPGLGNA